MDLWTGNQNSVNCAAKQVQLEAELGAVLAKRSLKCGNYSITRGMYSILFAQLLFLG